MAKRRRNLEETMVKHQTSEYIEQQRNCPQCGKVRTQKGQHEIVFRSLFGKLKLQSPRLYTCSCQPQSQHSFSPLAERLSERTAPELLYLQTKWASLMSYGLTVDLLEEVLPISAGENRKAGWFEVIVGKSITTEGEKKCFGFVHDYDDKPKRRLFELLKSQGLQMNQTITFLSDGGDTVRDLQFYHTPFSEHVLDWFHITMRPPAPVYGGAS